MVSAENYLALKRLGNAGDSFNDVVTEDLCCNLLLEVQVVLTSLHTLVKLILVHMLVEVVELLELE